MRELAALRMVWRVGRSGRRRLVCVPAPPGVFERFENTGSSRTHTRQTHEPHKPNHLKINPIRTDSRARPHPIFTAAVLGFLASCRIAGAFIVFLL